MREIKFRGKRYDNGEWIYGGIWQMEHTNRHFILDLAWFNIPGPYDIIKQHFQIKGIEVIPATVGQYTGMKDKDGKEIYEGDVFHFTNEDGYECTSEVRYDEVDGCFCITETKYIYGVNYAIEYLNANLIGNIHDNPELLKTE